MVETPEELRLKWRDYEVSTANLPPRRQEVRLGELAEVKYGKAKPKVKGHIPVVGSGGVYDRTLKALIDSPTLIVGRKGTAGMVWLQEQPCWPSDTTFYLDWIVDSVDYRFIYYALQFRPLSGEHARTTLPSLQKPDLENYLISLPQLAEQRSIVRTLQSMQNAIAARRRELALERERKAALMQHLFTHGTRPDSSSSATRFGRVPTHWTVLPLSECAEIQTGVAKGRRLGGEKTVIVPYLRVANVQDGRLDLREIKEIELRASEVGRYRLQDGDVLMTEGGDLDKLGRGFIWRGQIPDCVHQNHIFAVRTKRDVLLPDFLACLIQSNYGKAYFLSVAHKTTNLASINTTKLKALPVPVPSLSEQYQIVEALNSCDAMIDALEREITVLDELFRAMLEELMTGRVSALPLAEREPVGIGT
ncbi:MAG TPA: restriction endonuclease subunit S [Chloroflexota bacterium]|nr:restriction endonuclease subunit S [Chloroflexota bacterium]HZS89532.1 restriction endonuclease subunit S [Chloroflexota bacterium]